VGGLKNSDLPSNGPWTPVPYGELGEDLFGLMVPRFLLRCLGLLQSVFSFFTIRGVRIAGISFDAGTGDDYGVSDFLFIFYGPLK